MTDQKIKADAGKPKLTLVPLQILYDIAAIREYGNNKYPEGGPDNWKKVDIQRYRDAAFRHFVAYIQDPHGVDLESGLPHRWHLECNLAFLAELESADVTKEPSPNWRDCSHCIYYGNDAVCDHCDDSYNCFAERR